MRYRSGEGFLRLCSLYKKLGNFDLRNISLNLERAEYFVVLGPSGAGKTLLLEIIAGLQRVDSGETWLGENNITLWPPEKRLICFKYKNCALFPHLNVKDNITFSLKVRRTHPRIIKKELDEVVDLLGISHLLERYPATLSGGEKQRVALARALVMKPQVLLLDEPLSALDVPAREALRKELKHLHKLTGMLMIHVTHDFTEAMSLADRVAVIVDGALVQVGYPDEIFNRPQSRAVADFVGAQNIFQSKVIIRNGKKFVLFRGSQLAVETDLEGTVNFSFRPEDVVLSSSRQPVNCLQGVVDSVARHGLFTRVVVEVEGTEIVALFALNGGSEYPFCPGKPIFCVIPPKVINVFPCETDCSEHSSAYHL